MTVKFEDRYREGVLKDQWTDPDDPDSGGLVAQLWLIRGLSGSGKSRVAEEFVSGWNDSSLIERCYLRWRWRALETDQYFCRNPKGEILCRNVWDKEKKLWVPGYEYRFDRKKKTKAHAWCQEQAELDLKHGMSCAVSNTFSTRWEMEPYIKMAKAYEAMLFVIDLYDGGCTDEELAARSTHNVPLDTIQRMRKRWEHDWGKGDPRPPWEREKKEVKHDEAAEKIMKAADRYASWKKGISDAHDRGTTEDWEEAQRMAKESRRELEQTVKATVGTGEKKEGPV